MAILTKGIFGPITGSLGNLVFCICVNGTNYVRTKPNKTKKPPSMAQTAQRKRFAIAAKFLNPLKDILNKGFHKNRKKGTSAMSVAMGAMLGSDIIGDAPDFPIDFSRVELSRGSLQHTPGLRMKVAGRDIVMLEWDCQTNQFNSFADDTVLAVVYNVTQEKFVIGGPAYREDEVMLVKLEGASPEDRFVMYAFMETRNGNTCAQFVGEFSLV